MSSVTNMEGTFLSSVSFNGDISQWDVSSVTDMDGMFCNAASFKQNLCGSAWVHSKASRKLMFVGSFGSITQTVCTLAFSPGSTFATRQYVSRRPMPGRELILKTSITTSVVDNMVSCSKCSTFKKSGRISCCAPGGSWYKNCGGAGSGKGGHRWSEGVKACARKFKGLYTYVQTEGHAHYFCAR